jgi:hypothetical protein
MREFYPDSKVRGTSVIVHRIKGVPVAVMQLVFESKKVNGIPENVDFSERIVSIEYLAVDLSVQHKHIGVNLLQIADALADGYNANKIVLEAVAEREGFYKYNGYARSGKPFRDPEWGDLIPMEKSISAIRFPESKW